MSNFLTGLGQGLQGFGQALSQGMLLKEQARQDALRMALQMEDNERQLQTLRALEQQRATENERWNVGNTPAGTVLSPEDRQRREQLGFGAFVRPEMMPTAEARLNVTPGLPGMNEGPGLPSPRTGVQAGLNLDPRQQKPAIRPQDMADTGRGIAVPTEDTKARTALANQQASMERMRYAYEMRASIAAEKNRIDMEIAQARINDPAKAQALELRKRQLDLVAAQLDQRRNEFNADEAYRWGPGLQNMQYDNDLAAYIAEFGRPSSGGAGGGNYIDLSSVLRPGGGAPSPQAAPQATPAAPAKERPAPPKSPTLQRRIGETWLNSDGDTVTWDGQKVVLVKPASKPKTPSPPKRK